MVATLVQSKAAAQNTGLATVAATWDTAATAGNLLLLAVGADDYAASPPSGWTQSTGCKQETFLGHYVWWKVAAGGETSVNYTIGSASPSCWATAEISGLEASPYDISNGQLVQSSGDSYTTPTIIPTTGERFLVASMGFSKTNAFTGMDTWLNSFTEFKDVFTTLGSGTRDSVGAATRTVTGDGATGYSSGATSQGTGSPTARTAIIISFKVASGGGGTTFTQTLTGAATPTGTVAKQTSKILAATVTSSGTLARRTSKALAGSVTPTGALAVIKAVLRTFSGSVTSSGALANRANKPLSGATTPIGTLTRRVSKTFTGSVTPSGALSVTKVVLLALAGTVTASGALLRQTRKPLAGAVTPTGAVTRSLARTLTGTTTPAGAVTKRTAKTFTGSTTPTGSLAKTVGKALAGTVSTVGSLLKQAAKRFLGSVTPSGSLATSGGTSAPVRAIELAVGVPQTTWHTGRPETTWLADSPQTNWHTGRPGVR